MLAQTPPMGWNSWNTFASDIHADLVKETADKFIELGLDKAGYRYIVIDDCWAKRDRDPVTRRIVPDPVKFPKGMRDVSDYVHAKGLKFGMYSCAGVRTCADFPGSFDHEFLDAKTFADYGADFLKYDGCYVPASADMPLLYHRMGMALRTCGRDILFSACNGGKDDCWAWVRACGVHMYRSTGDIFDNFRSFSRIFWSQTPKSAHIDWTRPVGDFEDPAGLRGQARAAGGSAAHAPGCWNDLDMLTVGMFGTGNVGTTGCKANEYRMQFSLWCLASAPLMLGCDLRSLDVETLALLTNPRLIAIDQDPEGRPPFVATKHPFAEHYCIAKLLADGDLALGFFNFGDADGDVPLYVDLLGIPDAVGLSLKCTDVLTGEDLGMVREFANPHVPAHDCRVWRATPVWR